MLNSAEMGPGQPLLPPTTSSRPHGLRENSKVIDETLDDGLGGSIFQPRNVDGPGSHRQVHRQYFHGFEIGDGPGHGGDERTIGKKVSNDRDG